ncbi:MAG: hypothetical protein ACKVOR_07715 [Flavobacteriales bacterium]
MKVKLKTTIALMALAIVYTGCDPQAEFPDEPAITLRSFTTEGNNATLVLGFTDGDGNFGLDDSTWAGSNYDCELTHNLYCEYYELQNGQWVFINLSDCPPNDTTNVPFYYRVPIAEPTGQNKTQQGEISIDMYGYFRLSAFDTCRFEIRIVDRDLNTSNVIQTQPLLKPS